ncbi:MAG TPA: OsmC family protein [Edaphocola sp.]|nr:OsmC family protein [Edaphocola sp.]
MTSKIIYKGDLRTESIHLASNTIIETDAPLDNNGKGEKFSPTDLVATALGNCMLTIMGIASNTHHINIVGTEVGITKIMASNPRRIGKIEVEMDIKGQSAYSDKEKAILKNAALTCPVFLSLHPDLEKVVQFSFNGVQEH